MFHRSMRNIIRFRFHIRKKDRLLRSKLLRRESYSLLRCRFKNPCPLPDSNAPNMGDSYRFTDFYHYRF